MWLRGHRQPRTAILLICVCAVASACWFQGHDVWYFYARHGNGREQFVARYAALRAWLPADEVVRYVVDASNVDQAPPASERYGLALYAVSPRRMAADVASRWVVVDSDRPAMAPKIAVSGHWRLIVDLHNGVRLYRTDLKG
jgi:hypothetical protein